MATNDARTFVRFVIAGVINTLFGLLVYSLILSFGAEVWLALLTSLLMGIAFNFCSLGGYAFRDLSAKRLPRFVTSYLTVYLLNLSLLHFLQKWIASPMWCQFLLTPIMALVSYFIMSFWVFKSDAEQP